MSEHLSDFVTLDLLAIEPIVRTWGANFHTTK